MSGSQSWHPFLRQAGGRSRAGARLKLPTRAAHLARPHDLVLHDGLPVLCQTPHALIELLHDLLQPSCITERARGCGCFQPGGGVVQPPSYFAHFTPASELAPPSPCLPFGVSTEPLCCMELAVLRLEEGLRMLPPGKPPARLGGLEGSWPGP